MEPQASKGQFTLSQLGVFPANPPPLCCQDKVYIRGGSRNEAAGGASTAEKRVGGSISPSCQARGQTTHGFCQQAIPQGEEASGQALRKHIFASTSPEVLASAPGVTATAAGALTETTTAGG